MRNRTVGIVVIGMVLFQMNGTTSSSSSSSTYHQRHHHDSRHTVRNPYDILGISPHASDKEMKQRYYKLCLQYHPDKLRQRHSQQHNNKCTLSKQQIQQYEKIFKDIQWAYSELSNPTLKRKYDYTTRYPFQPKSYYETNTGTTYNPFQYSKSKNYHHDMSSSSSFASIFEMLRRQNLYDYTNHHRSYMNPIYTTHDQEQEQQPMLRFIYHITIPLYDLYYGTEQYKLYMKQPNIISRIMASFRGRIGPIILYQSILYSIPIIRISKILSFLVCMYFFIQNVPTIGFITTSDVVHDTQNDNMYTFIADILPGYKSNTKIIFHNDQTQSILYPNHHMDHNNNNYNIEVQFILHEQSHPFYQRIDNNLLVHTTITKRQAKYGCSVQLPSLYQNNNCNDTDDTDIEHSHHQNSSSYGTIQIPPNTKHGDIIQIRGKGWPYRCKQQQQQHKKHRSKQKVLSYGDLFVTIHVKN